ncbi:methyl-accepting chemotaxis protein [Niallia oryzisoli]|uniref:Methyl-accepting chemotaxis protein n=1 Tax=Niallia oryzisoli TaxID=1737571 RepID=A0ABZ2CCR1_9BACI
MQERRQYKWGLRKQLVVFTTTLAIITYTTSAFIIYFVYPFVKDFIDFGEITFTIITLLLGIIWSGILAFIAAGFIISPLKVLEKGALQAAAGEISRDIDVAKSDNEVRSLGIAFNQMLESLRGMVQNIECNFNETNQKVMEISAESAAASQQANAIASTITEIAAGADHSAVSIQETAEAMEEVSRIAAQVEDKAVTSETLSVEMVKDLHHSKQVIQSLISGIESLANDHQYSLQTVKQLEENAGQVERVIGLVGEIAAQTNLLALNASIEAARAGEHGRGFAVVADEVRGLADESARAVKEITSQVKTIQQGVQNVVHQITKQVENAALEVKKGTETNTALEEMTSSINQMAAATSEIKQLVNNQMAGIKALSNQSEAVAGIAEETSAGTQEVMAAIQQQTAVMASVEQLTAELKEQAEKLKSTITRFKV